jgi:hypothetical protein
MSLHGLRITLVLVMSLLIAGLWVTSAQPANAQPTACANRPMPIPRAERAAGDAADQTAELGGGPFEQGTAARTAYLSVASNDLCNANNAFVHSYVAGLSRQGGQIYEGTEPEWNAALADGRVAEAIATLDDHLGGPGRSGITVASVSQTGCSHPPCDQPGSTPSFCPLAAQLPIVPAYPADAPGGRPGDVPTTPRGDGTDWVVIVCHPSTAGYRADMNVLIGSAGQSWAQVAVRKWLADNGDTASPVEFRARCRGGPSQDQFIPVNTADRRCSQA